MPPLPSCALEQPHNKLNGALAHNGAEQMTMRTAPGPPRREGTPRPPISSFWPHFLFVVQMHLSSHHAGSECFRPFFAPFEGGERRLSRSPSAPQCSPNPTQRGHSRATCLSISTTSRVSCAPAETVAHTPGRAYPHNHQGLAAGPRPTHRRQVNPCQHLAQPPHPPVLLHLPLVEAGHGPPCP